MTQFLAVALLILWAVFLFGGFFFSKEWADKTRRMPVWTRMASSFMLVIYGWVMWFDKSQLSGLYSEPPHLFLLPFAVGMTLGFIGDLFMAHLIPVKDNVLGGIAAFGLGHIAYIVGLFGLGRVIGLTTPYMPALIFWWIVAVVMWYLLIYRGAAKVTVLHYAALPYALLLATTTGVATGLFLQNPQFNFLAIGTVLFLTSDLILATRLFNKAYFRLIDDVVWLTYGPGQMLIVVGAVSCMTLVEWITWRGLF